MFSMETVLVRNIGALLVILNNCEEDGTRYNNQRSIMALLIETILMYLMHIVLYILLIRLHIPEFL